MYNKNDTIVYNNDNVASIKKQELKQIKNLSLMEHI